MRFLAAVIALLFACLAHAHERSESTSHWTLINGELHGVVTARTREVTRLTVPGDSYASLAQIFAAHVGRSIEASVDGTACTSRQAPSILESEPGYVRVDVRMHCPGGQSGRTGNELTLKVDVFFGVAPSHHHFLYVAAGTASREAILSASAPSIEVELRPSAAAKTNFLQFVAMGIEHIATGVDHLAFLLALLITARTARQVLAIVTGFTVGHSITLSLAVLGFVQANRGAVECLIGLTIAMAAAQNLIRGEREGRIAALTAAAIAASLLLIPADLRPDLPANLVLAIAIATGSAIWLANIPRPGADLNAASKPTSVGNDLRGDPGRTSDAAIGRATAASKPTSVGNDLRGDPGRTSDAAIGRATAASKPTSVGSDLRGDPGRTSDAAIGRATAASKPASVSNDLRGDPTRTPEVAIRQTGAAKVAHGGPHTRNAAAFSISARFAMAAGFGLIHGLGFASALQDLHLPQQMLLSSLLGFNVGVEIGQLAVVVAAVAIIAMAGKLVPITQRRTEMSAAIASAALLAAGLAWFLTRAY